MFLLPVGGITDDRFGILTAPNHTGVPIGIVQGMPWAADLGCLDGPAFVKRFDRDVALPWLGETMGPYRQTCLFVTVPDVVGDASATLKRYLETALHLVGWPLAYVAQDGQEALPFPEVPGFGTLFVGGTTKWKLSESCRSVIVTAQQSGKRIHIGRVNWRKRYNFFATMHGSEGWTCDGTRTRFEGTNRTIMAWARYMDSPRQLCLPLSGGDHSREPDNDQVGTIGINHQRPPVHWS